MFIGNTTSKEELNKLDSIVSNTGGDGVNSVIVNKFGSNTDIDIGSEEIIASFGGVYDPSVMVMNVPQQFTIVYNNTTDGSNGTGARMLLISYIDSNFEPQNAYHTLGNTGGDITSFSGLGINRCVVVVFGGDISNNNDITIAATVDTTIQAQIPAGKSVTQQALYHTPINTSLDLNYIFLNAIKISGGGGDPVVNVKLYSYSRVTNGRYDIQDIDIDVSRNNSLPLILPEPINFTGREVIYLSASTDRDNTKIFARFSGTQKNI